MGWSARRALVVCTLAGAGACADFTPPPEPLTLQLTAAQATDLNARLASLATGIADLAWLTDSVSMIFRAGTTVVEADLDTDFGSGPFYGVGLHRAVASSSAPFSTFHAIIFDDPANPTRVIVLGGWAEGVPEPQNGSGMGSDIPQQAAFVSANAHLFRIEAAGVTHWRAVHGHLAFSTQAGQGPCPHLPSTSTTSCAMAGLTATTSVLLSERESGSAGGTPFVLLRRSDFPGVRLRFIEP